MRTRCAAAHASTCALCLLFVPLALLCAIICACMYASFTLLFVLSVLRAGDLNATLLVSKVLGWQLSFNGLKQNAQLQWSTANRSCACPHYNFLGRGVGSEAPSLSAPPRPQKVQWYSSIQLDSLNMAFTIPRGIQASGALLYSFPLGSRTLVSPRSCPHAARSRTLVLLAPSRSLVPARSFPHARSPRSFPHARSRTLVSARSFSSLVPARSFPRARSPHARSRSSYSSPFIVLSVSASLESSSSSATT